MWAFLALALAYAIVKGTKWFLKVRRIKKFITSNFVPFDVFKYMDEESNNHLKQKWEVENSVFKRTLDPNHFIFEIKVGKSRIRHRTTLNINDLILCRFWVDVEIQFQSRSISDPTLSDIDFKNKMAWVWTTFNWKLRMKLINSGVVNHYWPITPTFQIVCITDPDLAHFVLNLRRVF